MTFRIEEKDRSVLMARFRRLRDQHPHAAITQRGSITGLGGGHFIAGVLDDRGFEIVGTGQAGVDYRASVAFPGGSIVERGINAQGQHFVRGLRT